MIQTNSSTVLLSSGDLICNPSRYILYFQITENIELSILGETFDINIHSNNEASVRLSTVLFDSDK
jgi:hypothetical protein